MPVPSEVMGVKFVIPICFIISLVHGQCFVVYTIVTPLSSLVKEEHFLGCSMSVNHVKIQALVLLHKHPPRGAPVIIFGDRNHLLNWNVHSLDTIEPKHLHREILRLRVQLHAKNIVLTCNITLKKEWDHWENFCLMVWSHHCSVPIATWRCLLKFYDSFR